MNRTRNPRSILTTLSLLLAVAGAATAYSPNPDLTAAGAIADLKTDDDASPRYETTYNLGPTGLRGWIYIDRANRGPEGLMTDLSRQILVTHIGTATPAVGVLAVDDVILGVGWGSGGGAVPLFASDCRKRFGEAIGEAEKTANSGILRLKRWRAGVTTDVQITLPVMGTYTSNSPYGSCPKSAAILANAVPILAAESYGSDWKGCVTALALLSTGDPAHTPALQTMARSLADGSATLQTGRSLNTWARGYQAVFLAEYYLATGDAYVVPGIRNYTLALSRSQSLYGTFGHKGAQVTATGGYNGSIPWYGPVNSAGLVANLGIVLGKKAMVASGTAIDPEIDPAIARAANFFGFYVNKGGIPYGEHEPTLSHADNGKAGMTAVMFAMMGDQPAQADYFARLCISTHVGEEYGHTGQGFSFLWTALGANSGGPDAGAAFLKEVRWHRDLARRADGSFAYDGAEQYGGSVVNDYWDDSSYHGMSPTATYVLQHTLPLKELCISGRNAVPANALSTAEIANAVWAGTFSQLASGFTTNDLVAALGEYDPVVRKSAATELGARTGEHATLRPTLIVMAEDMTDANKREGACEALGYMGTTDALPALGRRLSDPVLWVRGKAAEALGELGATALPELNTMLAAFTANATDPHVIVWDDPLQIANARLSKILFNTQPFRTEIQNEPEAQFYAAVRAGLKQPDGRARGHLSNLLKQDLSWDDVQAVAPGLVQAVAERSPADQMFSDGIRYAGLETLAKYKVEEGIPLSLLVKEQTWHSDQWKPFQILRDTYGTAASEVLPTLYDWQDHLPAFDADGSISQTRYDNIESYINSTIATLESGDPAPALNYFKTVQIVANTPLSANSIQLDATATDLDGGIPRYIWSRVSGPGTVSFSPNGTTASASTVATFDTPGTHVLRVAVADDSILDGGIWNKTNLGYVDFQTYEHDYGLAYSSNELTVVDPGTNWPPVAFGQEVLTALDTPRALSLLGYDYNGDALTYSIVNPPSHGSLSGTPPNVTYTPNPGHGGSDSFTFDVTDGGGLSSTPATVTIEVRDPLIIHVNMYASSGSPQPYLPEDPATLVGPAGGSGDTWNQFNTTSGSSLLDAAGAATTVGFTNNVGSGWKWGNPALAMLKTGRAHFGKGADTTHTVTGLTPGRRYNLWIASHIDNTNDNEAGSGTWSTTNTTTSASSQDISNFTLNGSTWQPGSNYVHFENVEADTSGEITVVGDATDVDELGPGEGARRLALSGFQLVELPPLPPAAPDGLVATAGDALVDLTWNPVPGASSYFVKRSSTPGGPYTVRANPATPAFRDAPAANGTTWYYVVSSVDAHGEGGDSSQASATPVPLVPPAPPTGLAANAGDGQVALHWNASATATGYIVKRGTQPGGPYAPLATLTATTWQDNAVLNGITWYYTVSAVNAAGEGGNSAEIAVLPLAVTTTVHVNFEQFTPGPGTPETESALEGPGGGLGTQWNQFADDDSAAPLVDSTGAATTIEFTTNFSEGRSGGSGNTPMMRSTLTDFGRGASRTLTITGLDAQGYYDLWLVSFRASTSARERTVGVWSTTHATISPNPQTIDNRLANNGATFVDGTNYVLFRNVQADGSGRIVFDGKGATIADGFDDDYRLGLSGFQLWQLGAEPVSPFRIWSVDPAHGLTFGVNDHALHDPENDGLDNLMEFVLGGHPMQDSPDALPTVGPDTGSTWVFEYDRSDLSLPPATTQIVEYGSDLIGWTEIPIPAASAGAVTVTPGDPFDRVSVSIPNVDDTCFARLKVSE